MRVALVCPYAWDRPGGVQSHLRGLRGALEGRGHEVHVIAPVAGRGRPSDAEIVGRAVSVPANGSVAPISFGPRTARRTARALEALRPDVVHAHEPLIPSLSLLALLRAPAPVVGTFHAAADSSLGYRAAAPILERAARRLSARTAVSDAARALVARYFPGDYVLTPNGVDRASFAGASPFTRAELAARAGTTIAPGRKLVLFLSRLERRKGLEVLVQAATRMRGEVVLMVCGTGPEQARCRALADRLLVDVAWLGGVAEADKARLFASADVFCAPGLGGESFGIVLIEAMAAGTPVVCSDLPGFAAVTGDAAVRVPRQDPGALATALRRVLTDDAERRRLQRAGARIASMFDWRRLVAGVEEIYGRATG